MVTLVTLYMYMQHTHIHTRIHTYTQTHMHTYTTHLLPYTLTYTYTLTCVQEDKPWEWGKVFAELSTDIQEVWDRQQAKVPHNPT